MMRLSKRKKIFLIISKFMFFALIYHKKFLKIEQYQNHNENTEPVILPVFNEHGSWGNYEPSEYERGARRGSPGEMGVPHSLKGDRVKKGLRRIKDIYGINQSVSDEVSLDRGVPDFREHECKHWNYEANLPKTSIIIVFYNEGLSTLFRTIHSVINRTPNKLLHEIILVDDRSEYEYLHQYLNIRLRNPIYSKLVRVVRNKRRTGFIKSKTKGAITAKGDVLVFLEAHCEVGYNWLPPLLQPIIEDPMTITTPIIDRIDAQNFSVIQNYPNSSYKRGIFDWGLTYKEVDLSDTTKASRNRKSDPYTSPTFSQPIFAIKKNWFKELEWFDPGLQGCAGGNFELSFKLWQCGGRLLRVPCSRVARVKCNDTIACDAPITKKKNGVPHTLRNSKRIVETWFDAVSKEYFYRRQPLATFIDLSNLSLQLEFKQRKNCKPFSWFTKEIGYEIFERYPTPAPNIYWGELRNQGTNLCAVLYTEPVIRIRWMACQDSKDIQLWTLTTIGHLSSGEWCAEHNDDKPSSQNNELSSQATNLSFKECGKEGNWVFNEENGLMYYKPHLLCLAVDRFTLMFYLDECDDMNIFQRWTIKKVKPNWMLRNTTEKRQIIKTE